MNSTRVAREIILLKLLIHMTKPAWVASGVGGVVVDGKGSVQWRRSSRESSVFQVEGPVHAQWLGLE